MSCEQDFIKSLRGHGFRLTPQREMILSALHNLEGLVSAEEVLVEVQSISTAVDISTVYRTLDLLQKFHVVSGVVGNDGQRRYGLANKHGRHIHLVCRACGRVTGADLERFQSFVESVQHEHGFLIGTNDVSISGLCAECCAGHGERDIIAT